MTGISPQIWCLHMDIITHSNTLSIQYLHCNDICEAIRYDFVMTKFNVPNRRYSKMAKKMVSWRLNGDLLKKLDQISRKKGWTTTDLVSLVLDQYVQSEEA